VAEISIEAAFTSKNKHHFPAVPRLFHHDSRMPKYLIWTVMVSLKLSLRAIALILLQSIR
jgi:hypothetical protein